MLEIIDFNLCADYSPQISAVRQYDAKAFQHSGWYRLYEFWLGTLKIDTSIHILYLFRQIGGSIGVAAFGAVFTNVLQNKLTERIPPDVQLPHQRGAKEVNELPAALQNDYLQAFGTALHSVYMISACVVVLAFLLSLLMKDVPLRK